MKTRRPRWQYKGALWFYLAGFTLKEISETLNIPIRTVKEWSRRGNWSKRRQKVKRELAERILSRLGKTVAP